MPVRQPDADEPMAERVLTYDETRQLRRAFPGIVVDGKKMLGDYLDIVVGSGMRISYKDAFRQAEQVKWLKFPR